MLPAAARMRHRQEFDNAIQRGRHITTMGLTVHLAPAARSDDESPRVGFVVSRRTGAAVTRNQVRRRLRHIVRARLPRLSAEAPGAAVVVQVKPAAAHATSEQLARSFDRALDKLLDKSMGTRSPT